MAGFCERQGLVRLGCKPLCWKMNPQWTGRRWKSSLRSCQYPGHTLDHIGKISTVAGRHVVNFQIASEISQSFVPSSRKYHFFFLHAKNSSKMSPDCCSFFGLYTLLNNVLHLISSFLTYFTFHPLYPLFHLYSYTVSYTHLTLPTKRIV